MRSFAKPLVLLALFFYGPGVLLPALHMEKLGRCRESSILNGCVLLFEEGEPLLGAIVTLSALVLPPFKLGVLLWLGTVSAAPVAPGRFARMIEFIGRFSCLEVFLTAILVALVRLDALVRFQPRAGLYAFALSALFGVAAAIALNQHPRVQVNPHEPCTA